MIVDAKGLIAGRLSTKIAKMLIQGESVTVINAEKAIIVGNREHTLAKFKLRVDAAVKSNPHFGPKYSRIPDRMLRRMVKGMLPIKGTTKERMIKRLKVYNAVPKELAKEKAEEYAEFACNKRHDFLELSEIAQHLGGRW